MKIKRLLVAVFFIVAVGSGYGFWRLSRELHTLRETVESQRQRSDPPSSAMVAATALAMSNAWPKAKAASAPEESGPRDDPPAKEVRQAAAPPALTVTEELEKLEATFVNEPTDPAWAPQVRMKLSEGLSRIAGPSELEQVECKSSLCRARYKTNDSARCDKFANDAVHQSPPFFWTGPYFVTRDVGAVSAGCGVSLYFQRENTAAREAPGGEQTAGI